MKQAGVSTDDREVVKYALERSAQTGEQPAVVNQTAGRQNYNRQDLGTARRLCRGAAQRRQNNWRYR